MKTDLQIQRTNGWLPERINRYKLRVSYAINKSQACNAQHREYSQYYCNNFVWRHKVTRHHGDNFITYANVKSLYNPPETNIILYIHYISIKMGI